MGEKKTLIYVLSVFGLLGILMLAFSYQITSPFWVHILENIGLGFLVACIVGILIELYIREQMKRQMENMLNDIGADVFKAALGHEFPETIWRQVTTHLLRNPVMRKDWIVDYHLEILPETEEQFIKAQICIAYSLINLNSIQQTKYPFACSIDRCTHDTYRNSTKFTHIKVNEEDIELTDCQTSEDSGEITCKKEITLKPGEVKRVSIHSESIYRNHETIPFSLTDPTENFRIRICKPASIEVSVDALHPREERLLEEPTASPESNRSWSIMGGLLPGNGVSLRWFQV